MGGALAMIEFPDVAKGVIRNHYDIITPFYRMFWGPHIHHGYWEGGESSEQAQIQLTERLAKIARIAPSSTVYDIGCGMGGSSVWRARNLQCQVTGVTLSPVQRMYAASAATLRGVKPRPRFLCADAEKIAFEPASADVVWSIECTEHLFDKPAFFRKAATWIKPGGRGCEQNTVRDGKANRKQRIYHPGLSILAPTAVTQKQKQINYSPQKQHLSSYPKCGPGDPAQSSIQSRSGELLHLYACLTHCPPRSARKQPYSIAPVRYASRIAWK